MGGAPLPHSRKYWRELNLAVEPQIAIARISADLNLAVRYGIATRMYASRKFWRILIWRVVIKATDNPVFIPGHPKIIVFPPWLEGGNSMNNYTRGPHTKQEKKWSNNHHIVELDAL